MSDSVIRDARINIRIPQETRDQAEALSKAEKLSLAVWLQLVIKDIYDSKNP